MNGDRMRQPRAKVRDQAQTSTGLLKGGFDQDVLPSRGHHQHPASDLFFVAGEVNAPGSFPLKTGRRCDKLISLAQGTKFNAAWQGDHLSRERKRQT
jgi:hypothetical protein